MTKQNLNIARKFGFTSSRLEDGDIIVGLADAFPGLRTIVRPKISQASRDIPNMFRGVTLKIDQGFQMFLDKDRRSDLFSDKERRYQFFQTTPETNQDGDIAELFGIEELSTPGEILANIEYLSRNMSEWLKIPEGQDEVNFILGYGYINGYPCVFYLEHELEDDKPEIHLHVKRPNMWGNDLPCGFVRLKNNKEDEEG